MLSLSALHVDAEKSFGPQKILCDVLPINEFKEGRRTDKITGYKYVIALPFLAYEKISVRVPGERMLEIQGDEPLFVEFENLEVTIFEYQGKAGFTAKATGVSVAKSQSIEDESRTTRAKKEAYPS